MKVLLCNKYMFDESSLNKIISLGVNLIFLDNERKQTNKNYKDVDMIICNQFFLFNSLSQLPNLKYVQLLSVGLDRFPINEANELGINVLSEEKFLEKIK